MLTSHIQITLNKKIMKIILLSVYLLLLMAFSNVSNAKQGGEIKGGWTVSGHECDYFSTLAASGA